MPDFEITTDEDQCYLVRNAPTKEEAIDLFRDADHEQDIFCVKETNPDKSERQLMEYEEIIYF